MAHFYGTVKGNRSTATRCGHKADGLTAHAASWAGAVRSTVFVGPDGKDWADVSLVPWQGRGISYPLYRGPVDEYKPQG